MTQNYYPVMVTLALAAAGCTVHLVAPYNSALEQRASAMEAEVSTWELAMRRGAGGVADDPRNPAVYQQLDKWRGEADAMLTLVISNDPRTVSCSDVATLAFKAIQGSLPGALQGGASGAAMGQGTAVASSSCEAGLVADLGTGIDDIVRVTQYCKPSWVPDAYFDGVHPGSAPAAPSDAARDTLERSCLAEFKAPMQSTGSPSAAGHGRAVSHLLTTLQVIIYVENRKKAAQAT